VFRNSWQYDQAEQCEEGEKMKLKAPQYIWGLLRIVMGWTFLWAFLDKVFGLGFTTAADKSWLLGNSPTAGFLANAAHGPFAFIYKAMAGSALVDWLFMLGLLLIGTSLLLGIGVRIAGYTGALLMFFMWTALLPPEHNPLIDEHVIQLFVLLGLAAVKSGHWLGIGEWWSKQPIVRKNRWME
jgi:thiosulfate dehydrogenase (quinone) large subunit